MKTITYRMLQQEVGKPERRWHEEITTGLSENETVLEKAKKLIETFNWGCREGEPNREVILVRLLPTKNNLKHDFKKHSLVTQRGGYDIYKCTRCGALGKRYGLGASVTPDKKVPEFCNPK